MTNILPHGAQLYTLTSLGNKLLPLATMRGNKQPLAMRNRRTTQHLQHYRAAGV